MSYRNGKLSTQDKILAKENIAVAKGDGKEII